MQMQMQKLEELLDMLVPGGRHQQDVTMLEDCLVEACDRARETHSKLGQLLDGPPVETAGQEPPSYLPALWTHDQLQTEKLAWPLPNQRYLTTSCMQVRVKPPSKRASVTFCSRNGQNRRCVAEQLQHVTCAAEESSA